MTALYAVVQASRRSCGLSQVLVARHNVPAACRNVPVAAHSIPRPC
ncbi:MAG: hypothetical protein HC879_10690 [Leptolyngbyaceae cyanobacterium SL_5_9]|nr:hypothetical protein [Leptolyngbyaceae cyanobacterium SL_5_9]